MFSKLLELLCFHVADGDANDDNESDDEFEDDDDEALDGEEEDLTDGKIQWISNKWCSVSYITKIIIFYNPKYQIFLISGFYFLISKIFCVFKVIDLSPMSKAIFIF